MKKEISCLADMIGIDLSGFQVRKLFEVYKTNDDGRKVSSLGFFKSEKIAKGFAKIQVDANWHKVKGNYILTDGKIGFVLGTFINILDDEEAKLAIAEKARLKLTSEEADALGLG